MMSLYELMNLELKKLQLPEEYLLLDNFIYDEKKCVSFINYLIGKYKINFMDGSANGGNGEIFLLTQNRAKHSVITYLMGKVLSDFGDVYGYIAQTIGLSSKFNDIIWMLTSLYHDIGYFYPSLLRNKDIKFKDEFSNYLLNDENEYDIGFSQKYNRILAYSYSEIEAYDVYAREYHLRNNDKTNIEMIDHGILGGCLAFDRSYKAMKKYSDDKKFFKIIKAACLTIAQHNIFKSDSEQSDYYYPKELLKNLSYTSDFRISREYPVLYLLSLVDTIEIIKRYGGDETDKEINKRFHIITLLKNILVNVDYEKIKIDYSSINSKIINAGFFEDFVRGYENNILMMGKWLDVYVKKQGPLFIIYNNSF